MINWGSVPAGSVLPFPFASYGKTNGESITLTGLAITDVEIYKGITVTQRASDAGVVLIDTDGIDIDGTTGIHGFSIDTGDNTDAGFFVAGSFYWVVVSAVTIDTQTVNFIAGTFRLIAAEVAAGVQTVNADYISGDQAAAAALETAYDGTAGPVPEQGITDQGTAQSATSTTIVLRAAATFADDVPIGSTIWAYGSTQGYWQAQVITDYVSATDTATVPGWTVTPSGTITYRVFGSAAGQGVAQTGDAYAVVANPSHGNAALKVIADNIPTNAELATALATTPAAVLAAATATPIAANIEQINAVPLVGNGAGTPFGV